MNNTGKIIIAVGILLGLALNGYFIGKGIERFRREDRSIAVKGFSEREVKANFAVWNIKSRITTNDLAEGSRLIEQNKAKIIAFLAGNGIREDEIIPQDLNVTDKLARDYGEQNQGGFRYIIELSIQVRSPNVDDVQKVSRMNNELLKAGVIVSSQDYMMAVQYQFTDLNKIKPEMLAEATRNAKQAAEEFTRDSGVKLGDMKKASQGLFTIIDRDNYNAGQTDGGGYYGPGRSDIFKKVRVVINVEYSIE